MITTLAHRVDVEDVLHGHSLLLRAAGSADEAERYFETAWQASIMSDR